MTRLTAVGGVISVYIFVDIKFKDLHKNKFIR